ncbi:MAG: hypothetical protein M1819_003252 [Sarea resinae]|nr:MAG: hypothetical protein M1819_003252 [Sarea resinae]
MLPSWSRQLSSSSRGPHPAGKRIEIVNFLVNDAVRKITGVESVGVSLRTHTDYADLVDDISHTTVNYSRIVDQLRSLSGAEASFPHSLATNIADHVLSLSPSIAEAKVSLTLIPDFVSPRVANGTVNGSSASIPRPSRQIVVHKSQAASVDLAIAKQASTSLSAPFSYTVEGYQFNTIVGVLKTERQKEQPIILDITLSSSEAPSGAPENVKIGNHETSNGFQPLAPSLDNHQLYTHISESIQQLAKKSSFYTLEAYSSRLASHAFEVADEHELGSSLDSVTIRLRKPDAFADAEYAAVSTTRTRTDFGRPDYAKIDEVKARGKHRAFIALGSNMGDRIQMIEKACQEMKKRGIKMVRTSGLWETEAMYVTDQDPFVNGACEIETSLSPLDLLDELQAIENAMGRKKIIDKGPRNIDLDILLYDAEVVQHKRLHIPHALMLEREFVLRPLCE